MNAEATWAEAIRDLIDLGAEMKLLKRDLARLEEEMDPPRKPKPERRKGKVVKLDDYRGGA